MYLPGCPFWLEEEEEGDCMQWVGGCEPLSDSDTLSSYRAERKSSTRNPGILHGFYSPAPLGQQR